MGDDEVDLSVVPPFFPPSPPFLPPLQRLGIDIKLEDMRTVEKLSLFSSFLSPFFSLSFPSFLIRRLRVPSFPFFPPPLLPPFFPSKKWEKRKRLDLGETFFPLLSSPFFSPSSLP